MDLPIDKKTPTFADLKEKGISYRTKLYTFTSAQDMNDFIHDMEQVANNPLKYQISEFNYQTQVDGTPFALLRFRDDDKVDPVKENKICIWSKIFTKPEFVDLDEIINKYDRTTLYLLGEKRLSMKTGDFFIMLIWATVDKPIKFTGGIDVLRSIFTAKFT